VISLDDTNHKQINGTVTVLLKIKKKCLFIRDILIDFCSKARDFFSFKT
jgi:hypothetical protein